MFPLFYKLAIPIALYRPQIGPPARNGKKMAEKWILAPPGKRGQNGRKMGRRPDLGSVQGNRDCEFCLDFSLFLVSLKSSFSLIKLKSVFLSSKAKCRHEIVLKAYRFLEIDSST